jgi:hypothetical protein
MPPSIRNPHKLSLIALFIFISCTAREETPRPSAQVLGRYLQQSAATDPGEFDHLYRNVPESIDDICTLIKAQLIHPFDTGQFGDAIPKERTYEDRTIPDVRHMLQELLARDGSGLTLSRKPGNRLVLACVHHSLLLASILRHKGVPVRLRAGHATYIGNHSGLRVTHAICEVWDARRERWYLVDPDREKIDFKRHEFEFANETWCKLRSGDIDRKFYVSRYKSVDQAAAHVLWLDLSYITGADEPYWNDPPVVTKVGESLDDLGDTEIDLLDQIAALLDAPDSHLDELIRIKENNDCLNPD